MLPPTGQAPPEKPVLHWAVGFSPDFTDVWAQGFAIVPAPADRTFALLTELAQWEVGFSVVRRVRPMEPDSRCGLDSEMECDLDGIPVHLRLAEIVPGSRLTWHGEGLDLGIYLEWALATAEGRTQVLLGVAARGPAAICVRESEPDRFQTLVDRWLADLQRALESA